MKDRRGVEIKIGDLAVHATSGRYGAYDVVRVAGFTEKRVRVDQVDYMGTQVNFDSPSTLVEHTLHPGTLVIATLPHVDGRLNNESNK